MANEVFEKLNAINVNEHTEQKNDLTYLSWAWAWAEVMKQYPDATYTIWKDEYGRPYVCDPACGYMVYTSVTIEGITREMWLPVMDASNRAMKCEAYTMQVYDRRARAYKDVTVQAATMFDVNKTVMRCLTKNLAMFGLGLYIYAGEDLPEAEIKAEVEAELAKTSTTAQTYIGPILNRCMADGIDPSFVAGLYGVDKLEEIPVDKLAKTLAEKAWTEVRKRYAEYVQNH